MPNDRHNSVSNGPPPAAKPGIKAEKMNERTAAWGGLPGKSQPRTRDKAGTTKVRQSPKIEGL